MLLSLKDALCREYEAETAIPNYKQVELKNSKILENPSLHLIS